MRGDQVYSVNAPSKAHKCRSTGVSFALHQSCHLLASFPGHVAWPGNEARYQHAQVLRYTSQEPGLFHRWSFYLADQFQDISQGESCSLAPRSYNWVEMVFVYAWLCIPSPCAGRGLNVDSHCIRIPIVIMQTSWLSLSSLLVAPSCKTFPQKWYWWNHHHTHTHTHTHVTSVIYQTTLYLQDSGILIYDGDDTSAWLHCKEVTVLTSSWVLDSLSQYLWVNWLKWWSFVLYLILCSFSTAYYLLRSTNIDYCSHVICMCNEYCFF